MSDQDTFRRLVAVLPGRGLRAGVRGAAVPAAVAGVGVSHLAEFNKRMAAGKYSEPDAEMSALLDEAVKRRGQFDPAMADRFAESVCRLGD